MRRPGTVSYMTPATPATAAPVLISVREAAKLAGVSRAHVYRLIERGDIEAIRVGNQFGPLRIDREWFLSWLYRPEEAA